MVHYVYALIDPETLDPFYVGRSKHPIKRFKQHIAGNSCCYNRIKAMKQKKQKPILCILGEYDETTIIEAEVKAIEKYKPTLINKHCKMPTNKILHKNAGIGIKLSKVSSY